MTGLEGDIICEARPGAVELGGEAITVDGPELPMPLEDDSENVRSIVSGDELVPLL